MKSQTSTKKVKTKHRHKWKEDFYGLCYVCEKNMLVPTTDQEVKCCHHKDSAQTCIQYAKEAFEKGQQFSVSEAVKKEREETVTELKQILNRCKTERGLGTAITNFIRSREQ